MPSTAAIAIICKVPRAGSSKTRLIPIVGAEGAAALSRAFLLDLSATIVDVAAEVGAEAYAVCSPADASIELADFLPSTFGYVVRTDPVLGRVLDGAVADLLALGHDCVVLVNGDSPTLPPTLLTEAIVALRQPGDRVVFGPALDGGYTFVGLKRRCSALFEAIPWSTATVLSCSLDRAAQLGLPVIQTAPWYDIDDVDSLEWLLSELRGLMPAGLDRRGAAAPETRQVLAYDLGQ
ncbi:glycosyltransferase [Lichenihabitans sp. PAMC28606]|uniref:TIGR04282 family arsenosugar biosynthesis glycosyltransferase n=1 Tax=Lichenihabitans sp. PAMC28606 TaxID=2880932 RepID=UPI001D0B83C1|nr:TIGR04282 family arsenosugar biosynthesis glycosyltransferase [Lichenihabitans sp. PAMC28606]UDL93101.1 glycosyltransferase [Lichenihabitans sp. PAMC28606]